MPPKSILKSKTIWGVVLSILPQVVDLAQSGALGPKASAAVSLIGAAVAVWGRVTASRPVRLPGAAPCLFPILGAFCVLCGSLSSTGCTTTTGTAPRLDPVMLAVDTTVAGGVAAIVHNNPRFRPVVAEVRDRLAVLLARGYTSPELVAEFINELAGRYDLAAHEVKAITGMLQSIKTLYLTSYGAEFPQNFALDERAKRFLKRAQVALSLEAGLEIIFAAVDGAAP